MKHNYYTNLQYTVYNVARLNAIDALSQFDLLSSLRSTVKSIRSMYSYYLKKSVTRATRSFLSFARWELSTIGEHGCEGLLCPERRGSHAHAILQESRARRPTPVRDKWLAALVSETQRTVITSASLPQTEKIVIIVLRGQSTIPMRSFKSSSYHSMSSINVRWASEGRGRLHKF